MRFKNLYFKKVLFQNGMTNGHVNFNNSINPIMERNRQISSTANGLSFKFLDFYLEGKERDFCGWDYTHNASSFLINFQVIAIYNCVTFKDFLVGRERLKEVKRHEMNLSHKRDKVYVFCNK